MKITPVKGTNDYLPNEVEIRDYLQNEILKVYVANGFEQDRKSTRLNSSH